MTIKTRRFLFITSLLVFVILAPIFVGYAMGLRFDFKTWKFVETGGLFFRIQSPTEVDITLNDEIVKTTGSFSYFNNAFVQNLIPQDYVVKVTKDGYQGWSKTLKVEQELVTEAHNIVLLPNVIDPTPYHHDDAKQIVSMVYSSDKDSIALIKHSATGQTVLGILDFDDQEEREFAISRNKIDISVSDWQKSENKILLALNDGSDYIVVDTINGQVKFLSQYLPKQFSIKDVVQLKVGPRGLLLILKADTVYSFDIDKKVLAIIKKDVASIESSNDSVIYYVSIKGGEYALNRAYLQGNAFVQEQALGLLNFKISKNPSFEIRAENSQLIYVYEKNDGLLVEYSASDNLRRIDGEITAFSLSGDLKRVLYQKKNEIWVYYRDDIKIQPFKYIGQRELVAKIPQDITSSQWYTATDNHIIYSFEDNIKFVELDERNPRNTFHIAKMTSSQLSYDRLNDKLYILSGGSLYTVNLDS